MSINTTQKEYIKDLLLSNRSDFATIEAIEFKAKAQEKELERKVKGAKSTEQVLDCYRTCARIISYYSLIRVIKNDIRGRLNEIDKIRGCTKQCH